MSIRLILHGFALVAGLLLASSSDVALAQQNLARPSAVNMTSINRGQYSAGPIGGVQQFNPAWHGNGLPASASSNTSYGLNDYSQYRTYATRNYVGNGFYGGYAAGYGYGYANGYNNGFANGYGYGYPNTYGYGNGWSVTNWPVPYAVPGATGNAYIQLPSYGFSGVMNGTSYGVARYGSYSRQVGAFGVPFGRAYGITGSYTGASGFGR